MISRQHQRFVVIAVVAVVFFGTVGFYSATSRSDRPPGSVADGGAAGPQSEGGEQSLGTVDEMIRRLQQRLQEKPADGDGWQTLGWALFNTERFDEAARAYARAAALTPKKPGLKTVWGEALVRAADGRVTPDASKIFDEAVALEPKNAKARFYKGLALEQSGDGAGALDVWIATLRTARDGDTWAPELRTRVSELAAKLGKDISEQMQVATAEVATPDVRPNHTPLDTGPGRGDERRGAASSERGPSEADVEMARTMAAPDRAAMIRGMVDGLAQRLKQSPRDVDGWIKLMRSRMVLGETDAARAALNTAMTTFEGSPTDQTALSSAARALGVMR